MHKPIALLSTPWPLFNRPSIQLGALKSYIRKSISHCVVDAYHTYFKVAEDIGYDLYKQISERTWLSESLYAAILYPERKERIEQLWRKQTSRFPLLRLTDFHELCRRLKQITDQFIDGEDWDRYFLLGFSICFGQLTSSIYFIRQIKRRTSSAKVVVGGSHCAGKMGESLLNVFQEIDYIIQGEGERPLVHLIRSLEAYPEQKGLLVIPGLLSRGERHSEIELSQVRHLDELPIPDYTEYFGLLRSLNTAKQFLPKIPMEISRGCWWRKSTTKKAISGCAFCNLNIQWRGYRSKSHHKVAAELDSLTDRFQVLSISFVDNLLPRKDLKVLFKGLGALGKDFRFFGELRALAPPDVLAAMGDAGMGEVQVGIEALSTSLLRRLNKGTSAIDNVEIMKHCETLGLPDLTGNLILNFPTSDEADVSETLSALEFVYPFRPLKPVPFSLGYGSPVYKNPKFYGLSRVRNHPFYAYLFPAKILSGLTLMTQTYQGGARRQNQLWKPVKEKLDEWSRNYLELHRAPGCDPILSYRDGRRFLIIRERRPGTQTMTHRLVGTSRKIYLFCQTQRSLRELLSRFPGFGEDKILSFLKMMVEKRLVFREQNHFIGLAVPANPSDKVPESLPSGSYPSKG
jgi:ribosomal peptide maturation radical SAM protein 1